MKNMNAADLAADAITLVIYLAVVAVIAVVAAGVTTVVVAATIL
ncbi:hypothetical protein [Clostridium sporogenes]|nr:hypothetical protein [Clostridium sporogenes]